MQRPLSKCETIRRLYFALVFLIGPYFSNNHPPTGTNFVTWPTGGGGEEGCKRFQALRHGAQQRTRDIFHQRGRAHHARNLPFNQRLHRQQQRRISARPHAHIQQRRHQESSRSNQDNTSNQTLLHNNRRLRTLPPRARQETQEPQRAQVSSRLLQHLRPNSQLRVQHRHRHQGRRRHRTSQQTTRARLRPPRPPPTSQPRRKSMQRKTIKRVPTPTRKTLRLRRQQSISNRLLHLSRRMSITLKQRTLNKQRLSPSSRSRVILQQVHRRNFRHIISTFKHVHRTQVPSMRRLFRQTKMQQELLRTNQQNNQPLRGAPRSERSGRQLLQASHLLSRPTSQNTRLPDHILRHNLLQPLLLQGPIQKIHVSQQFTSTLKITIITTRTFRRIIRPQTRRSHTSFPNESSNTTSREQQHSKPKIKQRRNTSMHQKTLILRLCRQRHQLTIRLLPSTRQSSKRQIRLRTQHKQHLSQLRRHTSSRPRPLRPMHHRRQRTLSRLSKESRKSNARDASNLRQGPRKARIRERTTTLQYKLRRPFTPVPSRQHGQANQDHQVSKGPRQQRQQLHHFHTRHAKTSQTLRRRVPRRKTSIRLQSSPHQGHQHRTHRVKPQKQVHHTTQLLRLLFLHHQKPITRHHQRVPTT